MLMLHINKNSKVFTVYKKAADILIAWMKFANEIDFCFGCALNSTKRTHGSHKTYNVSMINKWHLATCNDVCALLLSCVRSVRVYIWCELMTQAELKWAKQTDGFSFNFFCDFMASLLLILFVVALRQFTTHIYGIMELWNTYESSIDNKNMYLHFQTPKETIANLIDNYGN